METVADNEDEEDTNEQRRSAKSPAHNTRSKNPNFCSISQEAMLLYVNVAQLTLSPKTLASRLFPMEMLNAVLCEDRQIDGIQAPDERSKVSLPIGEVLHQRVRAVSTRIAWHCQRYRHHLFHRQGQCPHRKQGRDVTYGRIVVNYRPETSDPYRTCLTVGGN